MPRPSRRAILLTLKVGVTLGLLAMLGHTMLERDGVDVLRARIGALDPAWIAIAIALHFAAVLGGVFRWRALLRASGVSLPFAFLARSYLVGRFVGAFTPSTTGLDGYRIYDAGRRSGAMAESATAIGIEKLVGLVGMSAVSATLLPFGGLALLGTGAVLAAILIGGGAVALLALIRFPRVLRALVSRTPLHDRAERGLRALEATRLDAATLSRTVLLGMFSHFALSAVFLATARAIGIAIDPGTLLVVGNAIVLAVLLPVAIGGVGVREGVAVVLLSGAGVDATDAMLIASLGYLTGQAPAVLGGLCSLAVREVSAAEVATPSATS